MSENLLPVRRPQRLPAEQKLALAVIEQAFADANDLRVRPAVRSEARRFISGSLMLAEWCDVARIDPALMSDLTARFLRGLFDVVSDQPARPGRDRRTRREVPSRGHEQPAARVAAAVVALRRGASPAS